MHEHKIYNHIIYHKCVQNYQYLLCLYKHATAYLLQCIICINSEHSTSISGSALSALISIITTPVLISCVDYKHCKGFRCCDKTHIQLMIQFILFRVDLQAEILASMDIRPMLCIPAMLVKQLATFAVYPQIWKISFILHSFDHNNNKWFGYSSVYYNSQQRQENALDHHHHQTEIANTNKEHIVLSFKEQT